MKRRDWKIKNLEKGIFGKFRVSKRIFFLRRLIFRKHKTLIKRDLTPNYFFLANFYYNIKKLKKTQLNYIFLKNEKKLIYFPDFLFKKKINNSYLSFKKIQKEFNFNYFFNNKKCDLPGTNMYILKIQNNSIFEEFLLKDENKNIISKKDSHQEIIKTDFNYYFNFNISLNNFLEIYKIIIYLYVYKNKNN